MKLRSFLYIFALSCILFQGCSDEMDDEMEDDFAMHRAPLSAKCSIYVSGYGAVDMETDYVPNVTACENGGAGMEALKAQAIAARTFGYYKLNNGSGTAAKPVKNSQGDQVYKCDYTTAADRHYEAANSTSGVVLTYKDKVMCSFYVSGSKTDYLNKDCKFTGTKSDKGWVSQQDLVTYNYGKTGNNITQSTIGWVDPKNDANRGCMAQNGARCLADSGKDYKYILQFFYGSDIGFEQAEGACVAAKKCETVIPSAGGILEETDACFSQSSSNSWYEKSAGSGNHLYYTYVWDKPADTIGTWSLNMASAGRYTVEAYIAPDQGAVSESAPYTVRANGKESSTKVNLVGKSGWVSIGTYEFASGADQWVKLSDASGEPYTNKNGKRVLFDAIRLKPAEACTDVCTYGAKECSGNGARSCERAANGCTVWSGVTECQGGQTCTDGVCKLPSCKDACEDGAKECSGSGTRSCVRNDDGCLVWSDITTCGEGQKCEDGVCKSQCESVCAKGATECDDVGVRTCISENGCMKWSVSEPCKTDEVCAYGACTNASECTDRCAEGATACENGGIKTCRKNALGCTEWSSVTSCGSLKECRGGQCTPVAGDMSDVSWNGTVQPRPEACSLVVDGRPSLIIDELDPCFVRAKSSRWSELYGLGYGEHTFYAYAKEGEPEAVGTWHLNVTKGGQYTIYAYIDSSVGMVSQSQRYAVRASGSTLNVTVSPSRESGWYKLGDFTFDETSDQYVLLKDGGSKTDEKRRVLYDALMVVPYGNTPDNVIDSEPEIDAEHTNKGGKSKSNDCSSTPLQSSGTPLSLFGLLGLFGLISRRVRRSEEKETI